ncbi:MAG: hypothetical protein R2738_07365 [Bacteroides graminisolvens]
MSDEFLYEQASFPECHGATIVETPQGDLVASFLAEPKNAIPIAASGYAARRREVTSDSPQMAADGV